MRSKPVPFWKNDATIADWTDIGVFWVRVKFVIRRYDGAAGGFYALGRSPLQIPARMRVFRKCELLISGLRWRLYPCQLQSFRLEDTSLTRAAFADGVPVVSISRSPSVSLSSSSSSSVMSSASA